MLRYLTAGESHGRLLLGIIEGIPAGLQITEEEINGELARRQGGYGRGERMKIEQDRIEIVSGVRKGKTIGGPVGLILQNKDWVNWKEIMAVAPGEVPQEKKVTKPRPGHADLTGAVKYAHDDVRNVLERASARETAMRVAVGAVAKGLIRDLNIRIFSHVVEIGGVRAQVTNLSPEVLHERAEQSVVRCADKDAEAEMVKKITMAKEKGDTLGGVFEVIAATPPVGLGSYVQWDRRFDARLAYALMSIQAIKAVEVGMGFETARRPGSEVHDEIFYQKRKGFYRETNHAGGVEGGITTGEDLVVRAAMKPLSTLYSPLRSVDIVTKEPFEATVERSDVCTVPAASVVGEAVVAFELASACVEKFGGDSLGEMKRNYQAYMEYVRQF